MNLWKLGEVQDAILGPKTKNHKPHRKATCENDFVGMLHTFRRGVLHTLEGHVLLFLTYLAHRVHRKLARILRGRNCSVTSASSCAFNLRQTGTFPYVAGLRHLLHLRNIWNDYHIYKSCSCCEKRGRSKQDRLPHVTLLFFNMFCLSLCFYV